MPLLRKDLKIGFLAGAILLVLAVAYALVLTLSGSDSSRQAADAGTIPDPAVATETQTLPQAPAAPEVTGAADEEASTRLPLLAHMEETPTDDWSVYGFEGNAPAITNTPTRGSSSGAIGQPTGPEPSVAPPGDTSQQSAAETAAAAADVQLPPLDALPSVRTHVVANGESFSSIAQKYYGDVNLYALIQKANPQVDSTRMKVGQKLWIPDRETPKPPPAQQPAPSAAGGVPDAADASSYTVQPGDTLALIASRRLGREALWEEVYKLNRNVIGSDPAKLKVGMKLKLPQ